MLSSEPTDDESATTDAQGEGETETDGAGTDVGSDERDPTRRSISKDDAFHLLQNGRRRAVLRYLLARSEDEGCRMRDLAEDIAAWEHDTTVRQLSSEQRQRVYIALYQSHLPKLDEYGVIEYNQSRGFVEPTPLLAVFAPFLESGLHADPQALALEDGPGASTGNGSGPDIVRGLSSLFDR